MYIRRLGLFSPLSQPLQDPVSDSLIQLGKLMFGNWIPLTSTEHVIQFTLNFTFLTPLCRRPSPE